MVAEIPVDKIEDLVNGERKKAVGEDVPDDQVLLQYQVHVRTADEKGAGTDANVSICFHGENGDTGIRKLKKSSTHSDKFERGHVDSFIVEAVSLGPLNKLRLMHDSWGLRPAWLCESVLIVDPSDNHEYLFPCGKWLAKDRGDKLTSRDLGLKNDLLPDELQTQATVTKYHVAVHTSDIRGAGTDATVHLTLYGEKGDTGPTPLSKSETYRDKFERNHVDKFTVEAIDIGKVLPAPKDKNSHVLPAQTVASGFRSCMAKVAPPVFV